MYFYRKITMNLLILFVSLSSLLITSCFELNNSDKTKHVNQKDSKSLDHTSSLPMQTVSVSVEGNGHHLPGTYGSFVAILERNLYPRVMAGGSSGAAAGASIMSLLKNKSVIETEIFDSTGRKLSVAQKSARVVSSVIPVLDSFLFLPDFRNPIEKIFKILMAKYFESHDLGHRFDPTTSALHIESSTGQIILIIGFFKETDFTEVILEEDIKKRIKIISEMWLGYSNNFALTFDEFLTSLLFTPPSRDTDRTREIKERYFKLFRSFDTEEDNTPEICLEKYNKKLEQNKIIIDLIPKEFVLKKSHLLLNKIEGIPMIGAGFPRPGKVFFLPDPDIIWDALHSRLPSGKEIKIPDSFIIQTTARIAKKLPRNKMKEKVGLENVFLSYYVPKNLEEEYKNRFCNLNPTSFVTESGEIDQLFSYESILVSYNQSLPDAMISTLTEPVFFRRDPIQIDDEIEIPNLSDNEVLLANGGWLDIIPIGTLALLGECEKADFIMNLGPTLQVSPFQKKSLHPIFLGFLEDLMIKIEHEDLMDETNTTEFAEFYRKLAKLRRYILTLEGKLGNIHLDPGWDKPSGLTGENKKKMDILLSNHRFALMMLSYENTVKQLNSYDKITSPKVEGTSPSFGINVFKEFSLMESKEEVENTLNILFYSE